MSIPVEIPDLAKALGDYDWAYLLTVRDDGRPHLVRLDDETRDDLLGSYLDNLQPAGASRPARGSAAPAWPGCAVPPHRSRLCADGRGAADPWQ